MEKMRLERPQAGWPRTRSIEDVLEVHLEPLGVPVLYKLPLGHGKHLATIPLGVTATLDADAEDAHDRRVRPGGRRKGEHDEASAALGDRDAGPRRRGSGGGGDDGAAAPAGTGTTGRGAPPVKGGILRVGLDNYIDSLNPFNYIESQAYNAMIMIFPQLVQYAQGRRPARDRGRLGRVLGDLGGRQGLDVQPQAGRHLVGRHAADRDDAAWTINTTVKYASGPTGVAAARPRARERRRGDGRPRRSSSTTTLPSGTCSRSWSSSSSSRSTSGSRSPASNGKGLKTFHPGAEPAGGPGGRLHDQGVREEGHDRLHPVGGLLRRAVQRRGGRAHVLHQRGLDDLRAAPGQPRLGRPGAVQRRPGAREGRQHRRQQRPRARRRRTSPGTRTRASPEP